MKDFVDVLKTRRSVRKYKKDVVPDELLHKLIDLARWAPSSANRQPWRFVVVKDPAAKKAIKDSAKALFFDVNYHIDEAPVVIAACSLPKQSNWHIYDISNLTMCFILAAHYYGLGACWIGLFKEDKVKEILDIPPEQKVIALITVGYPDETPVVPPRLEASEITYFEKWDRVSGDRPEASRLFRRGIFSVLGKAVRHFLRGGI